MKRLKHYKSAEQYKQDIMNQFFNWEPDKKNIYLIKDEDRSFYYKGYCDAEYEYNSSVSDEPLPVSTYLDDGGGGGSYNSGKLLLTNVSENFKSFKINGVELITQEGQSGPLYLTSGESEFISYQSSPVKQGLKPDPNTVGISEDSFLLTFDRPLTEQDSIVFYTVNSFYYIVLTNEQEWFGYQDAYCSIYPMSEFIQHVEGNTYKFDPTMSTYSAVSEYIIGTGVSNSLGLIESEDDIIPTTISSIDGSQVITPTFVKQFIPSNISWESRINSVEVPKLNNPESVKIHFDSNVDYIIIYLYNEVIIISTETYNAVGSDIIFPNTYGIVSRPLLIELGDNNYQLSDYFLQDMQNFAGNNADINIYGVKEGYNDFIPCTYTIEQLAPLKEGTYYANFEYIDNIDDHINDYWGFFEESGVSKFYKSGFKNLKSTGRYMFSNCRNLKEIEFSNKLNTINSYTIIGAPSITSLEIPSNIKNIASSGIYSCRSLSNVILHEGLETIGNSAFNGSSLPKLHIPKSVTSIDYYALRNMPIHFKISVEEGNPNYDSRNNCNGIIEKAHVNGYHDGLRWGYNDTDLNAAGVGFLNYAYYDCNFEEGTEFIIPDFQFRNSANPNEIELKKASFYDTNGLETVTYNGTCKNMTVSTQAFYSSSIKVFNAPNTITSFATQAFRNSAIETLNTIVSYCNTYSFECSNLKELNLTDTFGATSCCFSGCDIEKLKVNRSASLGCFGYSWYSNNPIRYIETNVDLCIDGEIYKGISKYGVIKCTDGYVLNNGLDKVLGKGWSVLDENNGLTFAFRILKDGQWVTGVENNVTVMGQVAHYSADGQYKVYLSNITENIDLYQEIFLNGESIGFAYISDHDKIIFVGDNESLYTTLDFTNEDVYNEHVIDAGLFTYDSANGIYLNNTNSGNKTTSAYCNINVGNILDGSIALGHTNDLQLSISTDNYNCEYFDQGGACCNGRYWSNSALYNTTSGILKISHYDVYSGTFKVSIPSISGYAVPELPTIETHPVTITTKLKLIENGEQITSGVTVNGVSGTYNSLEEYWEFTYLANTYTSAIMYNGAEVGTVDNLSEEVRYIFIGNNNESYKEFNCSATLTTTDASEYRITNNSKKLKALLVDGVQVEPSDIITIAENGYYIDANEVIFTKNKSISNSGSEFDCSGYELSNYIPIENSTQIIWNCVITGGNSMIIEYNANKEYIDYWGPSASPRTITLTGKTNTKYIRIALYSGSKQDVYLIDQTNKKYLFRGSNVELKQITGGGVSHTITYAFDKMSNMNNLFSGCTSLSTVTFKDNFDTSEVSYMSNMFQGCTNLTSVNFDILDLSNVVTLQGLFNGCSNLTEAGVANWDVSNVTNMKEIFKTCTKLNIDVSNWDVSNVTNMNSLFYDCYAITSLDLSNWDTSKVTNMGSMFWGLTGLPSIDVSSFNTSNVTTMNNMFRYCQALTSLDLSNFDTTNVIDIAGLVGDCTKLTSLIMKGNLDKVTTANEMFRSITTEGVFEYNNEFDYSKVLQVLPTTWNAYYPNQRVVNKLVLYIDGVKTKSLNSGDVFTINGNTLNYINGYWTYEQTVSTWRSIVRYNDHEYSMFSNLETPQNFYVGKLPKHICNAKQTVVTTSESQSVKLFNTATKIDVMMINGRRVQNPAINYVFDKIGEYEVEYQLDMSNVAYLNNKFQNCSNLTSIKLYFDTSKVVNMEQMFYNCSNLREVDISSFNTSSVVYMQHMFRGTKLTSLDLSHFDTSKVTNMQEMFRDSRSLTQLTMSSNVSKVTNVGNMFYGISTKGVLNYNCEYDYSKIINVLPSTWTPFCKNSEYTVNVKLIIDGNDVSTLNNGDVFTLDGIPGIYNSGTQTWQFTHSPSYWLGTLNYNGTTMEVNNGKSSTQFMVIGGLATYTTYWSNANQNIKLINNITNVKRQIVDGVEVTPALNYTFAKQGTHEVITIFDNENITTFSELFSGCTGLRRFNFMYFDVTNKITSTYRMFYDCKGVISIDLSLMDTSEVTNMQEMFRHCNAATSIDTSNFNTSNVTNMSYMFHDCYAMTSFDLSNFDTSNVTTMQNMFLVCRSCKSFNVSSFDTSNVTNMQNMFYQCQVIEKIDLSNFDMSKVTTINGMFQNSTLLTTVVFNTSIEKLTNVSNAFAGITTLGTLIYNNAYDLTKIVNVKPSSWYTYCPNTEFTTNVTLIINNQEVTTLNEGDSFTLDGVNGVYNSDTATWQFTLIPNEQFGQLVYNENVITIPSNYNAVYYFFVGDIPAEMCNLTQTVVTTSANQNVKLINNSSFIKAIVIDGKQELARTHHAFKNTGEHTIKYVLKDSYTNLDSMFNGCANVTKIEFNNFNTSAVTNMNNMFSGCNSLKSIDLSMLDTSSVTTMSGMFNGCRACESFVLNGLFTTTKVNNMSSMFADCDKLNSSDLIPLNTSKVTNMSSMFSGCGVTSLDLSTFDTSLVTNMQNMFYNCDKLVNLNLTSFNTSNVTTMEQIFYGCAMLESFNINKDTWITSKVTTMRNMFNRCAALTSIDVSGFDVQKVTTMHGMFSRCTNLQSLDLSNFVTTSLTNMEYMFDYCTSLEELDISNFNMSKVTTMLELFINSTNLKHVKMNGSVAKVTNVNNMFNGITTNGVLEYSCAYDYSKIIAKLPSTWSTECL